MERRTPPIRGGCPCECVGRAIRDNVRFISHLNDAVGEVGVAQAPAPGGALKEQPAGQVAHHSAGHSDGVSRQPKLGVVTLQQRACASTHACVRTMYMHSRVAVH